MKKILGIVLCLFMAGCGLQLRSPIAFEKSKPTVKPAEKLLDVVPAKEKILAYTMSDSNWLFNVLVLFAVGGVVLAWALKIKEGAYITLASIGGLALIVAFARWSWLIGLLLIAFVIIVMVSKMKLLQDVGIFAVNYAEGLKKKLSKDKVKEFEDGVFQPKPVKIEVKKIRTKE
ncbi:unnamed protein product [marine sediment metagenome]|uniref:Lipoprotein n=1 Tax=marine sediment metagenome TaxID=412755 RepID=X1IEM0_9ZZZZ